MYCIKSRLCCTPFMIPLTGRRQGSGAQHEADRNSKALFSQSAFFLYIFSQSFARRICRADDYL